MSLPLLLTTLLSCSRGAALPSMEGHDPARIVSDGGVLTLWYSGLEHWIWQEGEGWTQGEAACGEDWCILRDEQRPAWMEDWLPDHVEVGAAPGMHGPEVMYYTVADWEGDDGSACIGRATAAGQPGRRDWEDDGAPVICSDAASTERGGPFAIDAALLETSQGALWMTWGSHYSGVWAAELDPSTGHLPAELVPIWSEEGPFHQLARGPEEAEMESDAGRIEAAFLYEREGWYYLFVNWYACCEGVDSSYEIRVGRARHPEGPYFDAAGVSLMDRGGTLVLAAEGDRIGPGHAGIYRHDDGREAFSYHYYDAADSGVGKLGIRELDWEEGWPAVSQRDFVPD